MGWRPKGGVHDPVFCSPLTVPSFSFTVPAPLSRCSAPVPTKCPPPYPSSFALTYRTPTSFSLPSPSSSGTASTHLDNGKHKHRPLSYPRLGRTPLDPTVAPPASQTLASLPSIPPLRGLSLGSAPSSDVQKVPDLPKGRCLDANLTIDLSQAPPPSSPAHPLKAHHASPTVPRPRSLLNFSRAHPLSSGPQSTQAVPDHLTTPPPGGPTPSGLTWNPALARVCLLPGPLPQADAAPLPGLPTPHCAPGQLGVPHLAPLQPTGPAKSGPPSVRHARHPSAPRGRPHLPRAGSPRRSPGRHSRNPGRSTVVPNSRHEIRAQTSAAGGGPEPGGGARTTLAPSPRGARREL